VSDWAGGALAVWLDGRGNDWGFVDIYALRFGSDGATPVDVSERRELGRLDVTVRPNPFRATTVIRVRSAEESTIDLRVYDVAGRLRRRVGPETAGVRDLIWDGRGDDGERLPGGVYFVRCRTGSEEAHVKIWLAR